SLVWVGSGDAARGVACPALRSSDLGADPLGGVRAGQDQGTEDAGVGQVVAVGGRRLTPVVGARRDRAGAGAVRARGAGVAEPGVGVGAGGLEPVGAVGLLPEFEDRARQRVARRGVGLVDAYLAGDRLVAVTVRQVAVEGVGVELDSGLCAGVGE